MLRDISLHDIHVHVRFFLSSFLHPGGVFVYLVGQVELWWLFHTATLMWGVVWPLKYNYYKEYYTKYIHAGALLLGLVLPAIPVLVAIWRKGFRLSFLTHYDCILADVNIAFYGVVVPSDILLTAGVIMLIVILRNISSWVSQVFVH